MKKILLFLILASVACFGQVAPIVGNPVDRGPSLPATCVIGQGPFFKTSAADGLGAIGIYSCNATNTWTGPFGTSGGGGGVSSVTGAGSVVCSPTTGDVTCTGSGTVNPTVTAGSGGVTQNLLAAEDASNPGKFVLPTSGNCGVGIAATTATSGNTFVLQAIPGLVYTAVADGSITSGDVLIGGTTTPGRVKDSGGTQATGVPVGTCFMAKALASATVGQTLSVLYLGLKFGVSGVASYTGSLTAGHLATWTGTGGQLQDGGAAPVNVLPTIASLTWENQGGASATQNVATGPIMISMPENNSQNWRLLVHAQPSTPYGFITQIRCITVFGTWSAQACGTYFMDTVGGGAIGLEFLGLGGNTVVRVERLTSLTSDSGTAVTFDTVVSAAYAYASQQWLRLRNSGTTLYFDWSPDGVNFTNIYSEAVGSFVTPNAIGFGGLNQLTGDTANILNISTSEWTLVPNATL